MKVQIVTEDIPSLTDIYNTTATIDAADYINNPYDQEKNVRIINLCANYSYQSIGYYVSLLAEARGHKVLPNVLAIQDINIKNTCAYINDEIDDDIQQSLRLIQSDSFELSVYFGKNIAKAHNDLARKLYSLVPLPLFKVYFVKNKNWQAKKIVPVSIKNVPSTHNRFLAEIMDEYMQRRTPIKSAKGYFYDIALLLNTKEKTPPSNKKAIEKFISAGRKLNINIEPIEKDDYKTIGEYDALFIRETTAVNHYTYRFARKAAAEGLVVIDDPISILKCTNKVYLAELLNKHNINTPKTTIINKLNARQVLETIDYPCVIKLPDSSCSKGVVKANDRISAEDFCKEFFKSSELLIIQDFTPSEYDWRIGVIDNKAIFACRYFMAKEHWQIFNWNSAQKLHQTGSVDTMSVDEAPPIIISTALKATKLIGDGLYGVDLKQIDGKVYVIEVNDNPTIDAGQEDRFLGPELYNAILMTFKNRLDKSHGLKQ